MRIKFDYDVLVKRNGEAFYKGTKIGATKKDTQRHPASWQARNEHGPVSGFKTQRTAVRWLLVRHLDWRTET